MWCRELLDEEAEDFLSHSFVDPNPERPWLLQRMAIKIPASA
jgi:pectinesterase